MNEILAEGFGFDFEGGKDRGLLRGECLEDAGACGGFGVARGGKLGVEFDQLGRASGLIGVDSGALFFREILAVEVGAQGGIKRLPDIG